MSHNKNKWDLELIGAFIYTLLCVAGALWLGWNGYV
jgi:hypothetical protein